jgi:hypothetical protein
MNEYLKKDHFNEVMRDNGKDPQNFEHFERLSSKAVLFSTGDKFVIIYVNTIVADYTHNEGMTLNTNGWHTVTSKKWINHALSIAYRTKYNLFQNNWDWFITNGEKTIDYKDQMVLI